MRQLALQLATRGHGNPEAYGGEADRISAQFHQRNAEAAKLEQEGHVDKAVQIYEAVVADMYDGARPYGRLRSIYCRRGQYAEALRVCRRFVETADALGRLGSPRSHLLVERGRFTEWCRRLETRLAKQEDI